MRDIFLDYLNGLSLTGFAVSMELPWDSQGTPLYLKNPKRLYVSEPDITEEAIIPVMNGVNVRVETTTVRVFLATDAKSLPSNYQTTIDAIRATKDTTAITGFISRDFAVAKTFDSDMMITECEFSFSKFL